MKKKIIGILLVITLVILGVGYGVLSYSYSKGQRSGRLVKLSKKGFLLKTYEGTLDLGSGDRLTWDFSVHNSDVGETLSKQSGQMITLEYSEHLMRLFYQTKYNVTSWKAIESHVGANQSLCRLVNVINKKGSLIADIKLLIDSHDPSLLPLIRNCAK